MRSCLATFTRISLTILTILSVSPLASAEDSTHRSGHEATKANFTTTAVPGVPALALPPNSSEVVNLTPILLWAPVDGATSYDVYLGTSSSPGLVNTVIGNSFYQSVMLVDNTKYYWKIAARNASGAASSSVWSFATHASPSAPGACVGSVAPSVTTVAGVGGTLKIVVTADASCSWTVPTLPNWITQVGTVPASGSQSVTLSIAETAEGARTASLNFGGKTVIINQKDSCPCTLKMAGQGQPVAGGNGTIQVVAAADCTWALSDPPNWVTYTGASAATGPASVSYHVGANTGDYRRAMITVGGAVFAIDQTGKSSSLAGTLAHFAAGGGWQTQFTLVNTGYAASHALLNFFDDNGRPVSPSAQVGGADSHPNFMAAPDATTATQLGSSVNPGAVLRINAPVGSGSQSVETSGWAQLLADGLVSGYGVFQLKTAAGIQEAVVRPEARNASSYYLPFDNTGGYFYGFAMSNASGMPIGISVVSRDAATGQVRLSDVIELAPSGHTSFVMTSRYPGTANTRGTLEFVTQYQGALSVMGLRFNPDHAFTSVPVLVDRPVALPQGVDMLPVGSMAHIAAGGGWKTLFMLSNPGNRAAKAHLDFFGDDGKPLKVTLSLPQTPSFAAVQASTFERSLQPGTMLEVEVVNGVNNPAGTSVQGWSELQTDGSVTGFAAFQYQPVKGGQQEAVVPLEMSDAASYILPLDNTNGYLNGVALANTSNAKASVAVTIRDAGTGAVLGTDTINLPARSHTSFLLKDRYASATANVAVTVEFATAAAGQISVLGLRFNANAAFTSVPAIVKQ